MTDATLGRSISTTRLLADIADLLESSVDAERRIRQAFRMLHQVMPSDACGLLEQRRERERFITFPEEGPNEQVRTALLDLLAELKDQPSLPAVVQAPGLGWASHLAMPLIGLDETIGVLFVAKSDENHYSSSDVSSLAVVAAQLASYLTNLFLAEQATVAIRVRDDFLASVSHDLRTPLTSISGRAQLLHRSIVRGAVDSQQILDDLQAIMDGASRMAREIDHVLAVAQDRIVEGLSLNLESTDLVALVRETIQELAPLHGGRVMFEPSAHRLIGHWDGRRLSRVCSNLVSNAVKYSPGQAPVRMSLERANRGVAGALLRLSDQGIGIPTEDLIHIFEPFHRAANSAGFAGTGLGLAGTKAAVEAHGGTISVTSQVGQGTTFSVWLPLHPTAQ